ncbi:3-hydroxyacyl-CoA dehydrogenase family protein [Lentzea aerocolonigenes]|uniref:3-hydroxyacyl-CoA dehydrogenase family protein n=1 Tax=Lentzea aerocolonigenes TaxID=68170 RepID=UPI000AE68C50|nr:3-hydroxyacyl-CoA dehydrogenase family protein [Lentzea aerocolonigenes]MCP2242608.1 methoxymalonate biosynthesis protein [Lentzea aerocolonigenes]
MNHRIGVLGAGVMGAAIATLAIGHGVPVVLVDVDDETLAKARKEVRQQLKLARLMGKLPRTGEAELVTTTDYADLADVTSVIEAVTEKPELKAKVLAEVSGVVKPGTVIVSNTSAIPVDEMADSVARPEDLCAIHFMNPPYLIRAVEVIRGPRTGDETMSKVTDLLAALDRDGVVVGDGPGFVINRILQRSINEAARIVEEGRATPEAVDAAFEGCLGHRTGPLATADLIGLDNVVDSLRVLHERTGDRGYEPCDLLVAKVAAGDFGRKTGRGFYEHGGAL